MNQDYKLSGVFLIYDLGASGQIIYSQILNSYSAGQISDLIPDIRSEIYGRPSNEYDIWPDTGYYKGRISGPSLLVNYMKK